MYREAGRAGGGGGEREKRICRRGKGGHEHELEAGRQEFGRDGPARRVWPGSEEKGG